MDSIGIASSFRLSGGTPRNDEAEHFHVIASERFDFAHRPEFIEGAKQSHS